MSHLVTGMPTGFKTFTGTGARTSVGADNNGIWQWSINFGSKSLELVDDHGLTFKG